MKRPSFVLAIHPHYRGFAWVVMEGPFAPYDWGLISARKEKNLTCLRRLERLIERYGPEELILESFERKSSNRQDRISRLCRGMVSLAMDRSVGVAIYSRDQVRSTFAEVGARSRQEIAEAVARHVEAFRYRLPPPRRRWESDTERLSLFTATALALTHYRLGSRPLLDRLDDLS